jgi:DNA-directed RNA polymerase subunit K/omega
MVRRPPDFNPYEFAVVSGLRAHQLMDGCVPQMDGGHNATTMAQMEVANGKVARTPAADEPVSPATLSGRKNRTAP